MVTVKGNGSDVSKYEQLTNLFVRDLPEQLNELERKLTFAYADHVRAHAGKEGAGLGGVLYDIAKKQIRASLFQDKPYSDENAEAVIDDYVSGALGIEREGLEAQLNGILRVPPAIVHQIHKGMVEGVQKLTLQVIGKRIKRFSTEETVPFRQYLLELAKKMGRERPSKEDLLTLDVMRQAYIEDLLQNYLGFIGEQAQKEAQRKHSEMRYK